jgi:hypothetical protein
MINEPVPRRGGGQRPGAVSGLTARAAHYTIVGWRHEPAIRTMGWAKATAIA